MIYESVQGWFNFQELYDAEVAKAQSGDTLVEVGCWKGRSLCYLLERAKQSGKDLKVIGIDHFRGSPGELDTNHAELKTHDVFAECLNNCLKVGYPFGLRVMPSVEAAATIADGSLPFVFIDAGHDYGSVKADILAWLPKVRPGGTLAGHDYTTYWHEVMRAVDELLPDARRVCGSSWAWVKSNTVPPTPPVP